jgi:hypothetical protein
MAKIRDIPSLHRDSFLAKVPGLLISKILLYVIFFIKCRAILKENLILLPYGCR